MHVLYINSFLNLVSYILVSCSPPRLLDTLSLLCIVVIDIVLLTPMAVCFFFFFSLILSNDTTLGFIIKDVIGGSLSQLLAMIVVDPVLAHSIGAPTLRPHVDAIPV